MVEKRETGSDSGQQSLHSPESLRDSQSCIHPRPHNHTYSQTVRYDSHDQFHNSTVKQTRQSVCQRRSHTPRYIDLTF